MEQRMTRHFFAAARQPKQLWEIPEASHAAGWHKQPEAYGQQLVSFFNQSLGRRDSAATNGEWDT
jgi:hypothetical protein